MINSTERSDILVFNCYLCHVRFLLTCYVCSTKIGEISDISKCFENFVSQTLGVLTRIYAAELRNSLKLLDRKGAILPTYLYYQYSYSVIRGKLIAIEQIPFDIPPPPDTNGRYKAISLVLHSVRPNSSTPYLKVIWDISIGDQQIADSIEYRFKKYYDMRPKIF